MSWVSSWVEKKFSKNKIPLYRTKQPIIKETDAEPYYSLLWIICLNYCRHLGSSFGLYMFKRKPGSTLVLRAVLSYPMHHCALLQITNVLNVSSWDGHALKGEAADHHAYLAFPILYSVKVKSTLPEVTSTSIYLSPFPKLSGRLQRPDVTSLLIL